MDNTVQYTEMKDSGIKWIGMIPAEWNVQTLYQLTTRVKKKNSDLSEQNLLSLSYGKIKRKDINTNDGLLPASFDGYNIIEAGDIVLRLTDLQNDHTSLRVGQATERGIITSAYTTLRPINPEHSRYLYYLIHAFDLKKGFYGMGSGVRQGLNYDEVKELRVVLPSQKEQDKIVVYLDDVCQQIDLIIDEAKASIDEYKKWKLSDITESVTRGLKSDINFKDSGFSWIGKIPQNWTVIPFTKLFESIIDYRGKTPNKRVEGVFLVTAKNIKEGQIDYEASKEYVAPDEYDEIMHRGIPSIGDVLFTTEAPLGEVANVDRTDIALAQRVIKFCGVHGKLDNYFLKYWIMSNCFQNNLMTYATGSTAKGIKSSKLGMLKLVLPPIEEQKAIVKHLDNQCQTINAVIQEKQALISELEQYKRSLIYETVTGKRKVV